MWSSHTKLELGFLKFFPNITERDMTTNGEAHAANYLDLATKLRGRCKFYHVGDPHRRLLEKCIDAFEQLADGHFDAKGELCICEDSSVPDDVFMADSVQDWLLENGVKLTPKQKRILHLDQPKDG
jgi:hypothetical protein